MPNRNQKKPTSISPSPIRIKGIPTMAPITVIVSTSPRISKVSPKKTERNSPMRRNVKANSPQIRRKGRNKNCNTCSSSKVSCFQYCNSRCFGEHSACIRNGLETTAIAGGRLPPLQLSEQASDTQTDQYAATEEPCVFMEAAADTFAQEGAA